MIETKRERGRDRERERESREREERERNRNNECSHPYKAVADKCELSNWVEGKMQIRRSCNTTLGAVFTALCNLQVDSKSWSITLHKAEKACGYKHSCLFGPI